MAIGSAILVAGWIGIAATAAPSGIAATAAPSGIAATAAPSGIAATAGPVGTVASGAALTVKQAELAQIETRLAAMKSATSAMPGDAAIRARSLEARQAFLAALLAAKPGARVDMAKLASLLPRKNEGGDQFALVRDLVAPLPISLATSRSGKSGHRGSARAATAVSQPPAVRSDGFAPFRDMEDQQLAIVDRATGAAEAGLRDTRALIRRLGLDPDRFIAASDAAGAVREGIGGPFIPASANIEPRFKDLFVSWGKLSTLQAAVASIPAYMPVRDYHYTSTYGVRSDPFNGGNAMHAGVDMAGSMGEPIYASADGVVKTAGKSNGYGNLVELDHGRGIDTRYGHLSKIMVHAGDRIRQGQEIGLMGSTGRSTGTHLHFEVRVDGRSVNPRPFLDASAYVLAVKGSNGGSSGFDPAAPQDFGPVLNDDRVTAAADSASMSPVRSFR